MTIAGTVSFDVSRDEALHAGLWILAYGNFDRTSLEWPKIAAIGERLIACWKRRPPNGKPRAGLVSITLPRTAAQQLWQIMPRVALFERDPIRADAAMVGDDARQALRRKRGRPALDRKELEDFLGIKDRTIFYRKRRLRNLDAAQPRKKFNRHWRRPIAPTILSAQNCPD